MSRFYEFRKRNTKSILFATIALLVAAAWFNRFIQDDAFISFRYADNLVRGQGLVWNAGEHVEGYTNFLWTLLMSVVLYAGGDPATWSGVLGLVAFTGSLFLIYRITLHIFQSDDISLLAVILLGTNYTFSAYATGGLETSLQTMFFLSVTYAIIKVLLRKKCTPIDSLRISSLLVLCMLLRLDSAILSLVVFAFASITIARKPRSHASALVCFCSLVGPFIIAMAIWLAWKLAYYGDIFPNSFYAKISSVQSYSRGLMYIHKFLASYLLYPIFLFGIFSTKAFFRDVRLELLFVFLLVGAWVAYVIKVGGDFMEFRFLVPILPLLVILVIWLLFDFVKSRNVRIGFILLILFGSLHHATTFAYDAEDGIEPISRLQGHIVDPKEQWGEIGKVLGRSFAFDPRVSIATTAAGAIPYYSRLSAIDMLGINDKYVARSGFYFGRAAGHERIAPLSYLQERKVNLIVSHPYVTAISDPMMKVPLIPGIALGNWPDSKALEIPLDSLRKIIILYLTPSPLVDSVIAREGWKVHQITKEASPKN